MSPGLEPAIATGLHVADISRPCYIFAETLCRGVQVLDRNVVRRLAAIVVVDAVEFSRMLQVDEIEARRQLKVDQEDLFVPRIGELHGRVVKLSVEGLVAEFPSVVDAVQFTTEMQASLARRNMERAEDRRLAYKMAVTLGDVMVAENELVGDDVGIAVRVEQLAPPGGVAISGNAARYLRGTLAAALVDLGDQHFEGTAEPVRVFSLLPPADGTPGKVQEAGAGPPDRRSAAPRPAVLRSTAQVASAHRPAIAVLPLENLNRDPTQEYFCDGMTGAITTDLSKFANLIVIAANSTFTYKGKDISVQDVGKELGVQYVLEGSVQRSVNRFRINAQLADCRTGHHLWAERFDRDNADLFDVQDDIIHHIVGALAVRVSAAERERVMQKNPVDMSAYELYLQGAHIYSHETRERLEACRSLFERAAELDSSFARAWGYLSYTTMRSVMLGWREANGAVDAENYARRAVRLDPLDYANHWDLAFVHLNSGRFELAVAEYDKALQLNANDADLLAEVAEMNVFLGEAEQAIDQLKYAMRLNPFCPDWYRWNLGWAYFNAHQYEAAIEELDKLVELPNHARLIRAASYAQLGLHDEARIAMDAFLAIEPDYTLQRLRSRNKFRRSEDEAHWLGAARAAGLPDA